MALDQSQSTVVASDRAGWTLAGLWNCGHWIVGFQAPVGIRMPATVQSSVREDCRIRSVRGVSQKFGLNITESGARMDGEDVQNRRQNSLEKS